MVQGDRSVDRLTVAKDVFNRFVLGDQAKAAGQGRPNDLIGLVTFAGYADSICPLTLDHNNLALLAGELEIVLQHPKHLPFADTNVIREVVGNDEHETFDSRFTAVACCFSAVWSR